MAGFRYTSFKVYRVLKIFEEYNEALIVVISRHFAKTSRENRDRAHRSLRYGYIRARRRARARAYPPAYLTEIVRAEDHNDLFAKTSGVEVTDGTIASRSLNGHLLPLVPFPSISALRSPSRPRRSQTFPASVFRMVSSGHSSPFTVHPRYLFWLICPAGTAASSEGKAREILFLRLYARAVP